MTLDRNLRASLYMMLSMAAFVVNDALIKSLDGRLPDGQLMFVRGALLGALIALLVWRQGLLTRARDTLHPMVLARAAAELAATVTFLLALVRLPFGTISAILQALPLAVTLGAAVFMKEPVGWRRWTAILIGFGGVLLIVRPGSIAFEPATLLVVLTVCCAAARDLFTRAVPTALPTLLVSAATTIIVTFAGALWCLVANDWVPMRGAELGKLAMAAVCVGVAYQSIVLSMRTAENVAYVVPYRYTSLLFAIVLGLAFFDEAPDAWTLAGAAIIAATGLFSLYRELVKRRVRATRAVVPAGAGVAPPRTKREDRP